MDVGLIGGKGAGKTTVFNLLTGESVSLSQFGGGRAEAHHALAQVPDGRLTVLAQLFHPKKITAAQMQLVDVPGLVQGEGAGPNRFLNEVRQVDALVHVLRGFTSEMGEPPHPLSEAEDMVLELSLSDLDLLERRQERLLAGKKSRESAEELELVKRLITVVEAGGRLDQADLSPAEDRFLRGYQFLTLKPLLWVVNLDEEALTNHDYPERDALWAAGQERGIPLVEMAGRWEMEVSQLGEAERTEFLRELGLQETGISRLARAVYGHLGLMSFLTAGEDEVRAWTIPVGTVARAAAGKIHSDIERGFIRAEVVAYDDLAAAGSLARAREQGTVRMEGKDYVMRDGDVVNFRFNV